MSAPVSSDDPFSQPPLWINPCHRPDSGEAGGISEEFQSSTDMPKVTDKELLMRIVVTAKNALHHADTFRDNYVNKTFKVDFWSHHRSWKYVSHDWLPKNEQVPKYLSEFLPTEFLNNLVLSNALLDSYEYLQKVAVGMEQVTYDQRDQGADFHETFKHAQYDLRQVLCEINDVLKDYNIQMRPDIQRDIMPREIREDQSTSSRDLRDWVIFRDYMNILEFVIQVFEHLADKSAPDVELINNSK